jgi:hypothetical protein
MAIIPHWTRGEGERWVAAWKLSGKSRSAFAREHGLPSHRLHYWTAALAGAEPEQTGFVEVQPPYHRTSGVTVICGRNARVEVSSGFDAEVLHAVVIALNVR